MPTFDDIPDDCLVHALSFLSLDDLNGTVVVINQHFRRLRNHESLDQTRTVTIICSRSHGTTASSVANALQATRRILTQNHTHFKIVGLGMHRDTPFPYIGLFRTCTTLELVEPNEHSSLDYWCLRFLSQRFPSVTKLITAGVLGPAIAMLCGKFTHLTRIKCSRGIFDATGTAIADAANLTEVHMNGCRFVAISRNHMDEVESFSNEPQFVHTENKFLLNKCQRLQRLNIKGATWSADFWDDTQTVPIPQGILVKLVRHHASLQWVNSDLTEDSVAMLKAERPDVTFVNEEQS